MLTKNYSEQLQFGKLIALGGSNCSMIMQQSSGSLRYDLVIRNGTSNDITIPYSQANFPPYVWTMITAVSNIANNNVSIYANGVMVGSKIIPNMCLNNSPTYLVLS